MSDDPTSKAKPPPPPAYAPAQTAKPESAPATPLPEETNVAAGQPTETSPAAPAPVRTVGPVIEYTMPEPKKSWLPTPAMIRNIGCLFKLIVGFTVLLCLGYFALIALNPKARKWATQGAKDGSGGPTPFKVINQILAIPAQALGKTDEVVKANNARIGQLDGLIAEEDGKAKRSTSPVIDPFTSPASPTGKAGSARAVAAAETSEGSPASVSSGAILALAEKNAVTTATPSSPPPPASRPTPQAPAPDSPDRMKLAGDIIIAHAPPAGSPRASAAFFYWVVKLNVGGVTMGKPARVLINNRLIYEGDEVNRTLGVVFVQLDPTNKLLVFRDQSGATVTRSY
jgi:hypothetical protein